MSLPYRLRENCSASCPLYGLLSGAGTPAGDRVDIEACLDEARFERGEVIYRDKAPASFVYCIRSGLAKLVRDSSACRKRIVRLVQRDGLIGMEGLFSSSFEHTAVAMGDVVACRVSAQRLKQVVAAVPSVQFRLLEHSQIVLAEVESWLSEFAGGNAPARERMARLLLRLRDGRTNRVHRLSLEDISALLGITIETASRQLAAMSRAGLLEKSGPGQMSNYYKVDLAALREIAYPKAATQSVRSRSRRVLQ